MTALAWVIMIGMTAQIYNTAATAAFAIWMNPLILVELLVVVLAIVTGLAGRVAILYEDLRYTRRFGRIRYSVPATRDQCVDQARTSAHRGLVDKTGSFGWASGAALPLGTLDERYIDDPGDSHGLTADNDGIHIDRGSPYGPPTMSPAERLERVKVA